MVLNCPKNMYAEAASNVVWWQETQFLVFQIFKMVNHADIYLILLTLLHLKKILALSISYNSSPAIGSLSGSIMCYFKCRLLFIYGLELAKMDSSTVLGVNY